MKYNKDAIVAHIEKQILAMYAREEANYQSELKTTAEKRRSREIARSTMRVAFADIAEILDTEPSTSDEEAEQFEQVKGIIKKHYKESDAYYFRDSITRTWAEIDEPVVNHYNSETLKESLELFKTGAPPEVTITDLRTFGFDKFVKYGY